MIRAERDLSVCLCRVMAYGLRVGYMSARGKKEARACGACLGRRRRTMGRLRSVFAASAGSSLDTCPNEGLPDTVVADVEVCGDCCEGHAAAVEISGFSNLLITKWLASKLGALIAQ